MTAARAKLDNLSMNNRNLAATQQELSAAVKTLVAKANEFHEEIEPAGERVEELSANKAHAAVYQHKSDVEALEVALKREQMQLLELLTQASGGRTEDLSFRNNAVAEVVNRDADASAPQQPQQQPGLTSPRKLSNPFSIPSASMFEQKAAAPIVKAPLFGGAVLSSAATKAPTVWKQPAQAELVPATPVPVLASSPVPSPSVAVPVVKKVAPKVEEAAPVAAPVKSAPPTKFNPFAAVGSASPAIKRGPIPPPPGSQQPLSATRAVPPPPPKN